MSPLVGVITMVAVTILSAALTTGMLYGMTDAAGGPAPVIIMTDSARASQVGDQTYADLLFYHEGGQQANVEDLEIIVRNGGSSTHHTISKTGDVADGLWTGGELLSVSLSGEEVCASGGEYLDVYLVHKQDEKRSSIIAKRTVPVEREEQLVPITSSDFDIVEGAVVPGADYDAEVVLLGTAISDGHGSDIPVYIEFQVGDDTIVPWPGDVNDGENPRTTEFIGRTAGEAISVKATGLLSALSTEETEQVLVLRDGDEVPDIEGFEDQSNAEEFVRDYIVDGKISLEENEAIFLFEIGTDNLNSNAADFQDAVVLVSMSRLEETTETENVVEASQIQDVRSHRTIICAA